MRGQDSSIEYILCTTKEKENRMIRPVYLLLLLGACNVFEPPEPWGDFDPPVQYRLWHAEVQTCISDKRSFDEIIWRKVYVEVFHCRRSSDPTAIGCFVQPNIIYLAQLTLNSEIVVKTEVVHYVRQNGLHDALLKLCTTVK